MPFSRTEGVVLVTCALLLATFVAFILYRLCKITAARLRHLYSTRSGHQHHPAAQSRVDSLLSRPGVRSALANRVRAANTTNVFVVNDNYRSFAVNDLPLALDCGNGSLPPPAYDEVKSVVSDQPPPSYHSKMDD